MQRIGGFRRKSRGKFTKSSNQKGKISLTRYFQQFNPGDRVKLIVEPAVQKGMYFPRFMGKCGVIKAKKGKCYEVTIYDQNKEKFLVVHPIHLKRF